MVFEQFNRRFDAAVHSLQTVPEHSRYRFWINLGSQSITSMTLLHSHRNDAGCTHLSSKTGELVEWRHCSTSRFVEHSGGQKVIFATTSFQRPHEEAHKSLWSLSKYTFWVVQFSWGVRKVDLFLDFDGFCDDPHFGFFEYQVVFFGLWCVYSR